VNGKRRFQPCKDYKAFRQLILAQNIDAEAVIEVRRIELSWWDRLFGVYKHTSSKKKAKKQAVVHIHLGRRRQRRTPTRRRWL
jgi:hypothetical protein